MAGEQAKHAREVRVAYIDQGQLDARIQLQPASAEVLGVSFDAMMPGRSTKLRLEGAQRHHSLTPQDRRDGARDSTPQGLRPRSPHRRSGEHGYLGAAAVCREVDQQLPRPGDVYRDLDVVVAG